ncbi:hypothetical protein QJQ45_012743 [Haematococcus lacustris]|nr:hypothetical protein QJQ45_012743 [Haematococcus lacustris]
MSSLEVLNAETPPGRQESRGTEHLPNNLINVLSSKITELEDSIGTGNAAEREAAKARRKELRGVIKALSDLPAEEKMTFLQSKYTHMASELIRTEKALLESQGQLEAVTRERDKVQGELRKTNQLLDKLQDVCRQLQKDNKTVLEEARRMKEEEGVARAAMATKFQGLIADVTTKMGTGAEERAALQAENDSLRGKLTDVLKQFESFSQLIQQRESAEQLTQARLEQQTALSDALAKKNELLEQANKQLQAAHQASTERNVALAATNKELQGQVEQFSGKFAEFGRALEKSNKVFEGMRREMDSGAQARAALIRERDDARRRAEGLDHMVVALAQEKQALTKQVDKLCGQLAAVEGVDAVQVVQLRSQKQALEGLCRALQQQVKSVKASASTHSHALGSSPPAPEDAGSSPGGMQGLVSLSQQLSQAPPVAAGALQQQAAPPPLLAFKANRAEASPREASPTGLAGDAEPGTDLDAGVGWAQPAAPPAAASEGDGGAEPLATAPSGPGGGLAAPLAPGAQVASGGTAEELACGGAGGLEGEQLVDHMAQTEDLDQERA